MSGVQFFVCLFVNYKSFKCVIAVEVLDQIVLIHELKSTQVALVTCLWMKTIWTAISAAIERPTAF